MTKPPTVIVHDMQTYAIEDTPQEFLDALERELSHIDWLRAAGAEADRGEWGEDLSDLTPEQMVALLSAKERANDL